jgi:hypothetical protein
MPMAERAVLCGGLKAGRGNSKDMLRLDVRAPKSSPGRVSLKIGDISTRMVEDVPAVLVDLLEVAAYVYCADQCTRRGGTTLAHMGRDWRRRFRFRVPVRCSDLWRRPQVQEQLIGTLSFLSEDDYAFDFVPHPDPSPAGLQPYLDFQDSSAAGFAPDDMILFSGGLDSFAGAAESLIGHGRKVALVSHQASPMIKSKQSRLVMALREQTRSRQLFPVPVSVTMGNNGAVEFSQRTRSFLFATLALVVARLFGRDTVRFYENGIISLNLPVASHVLGARASRTTHPRVLADLSQLFSLVLDRQVAIENPYFWKTKSDVVAVICQHGCTNLIAETMSCAHVREATRRARHCGVCSQCIDRRFGILGAGQGAAEPPDAYAVDLFRGARKPGRDVVMAESYVLHALKLAAMSEQTFQSSFGQVFQALPYLPGAQEENAARLHELHRRHGRTVEAVIDRELAEHATLARSMSLPPSSLLMLIQSSAVRLPIVDPAELEPPASEQAAASSTRPLERPLLFALDEHSGKVLFARGIEVSGAGFELVRELAIEHGEDVAVGRPPDSCRFVPGKTLAGRLRIDEQGLRQRVARFRRDIEKKFLEQHDAQLADDDLIQNEAWRGYRLSPWLVRVPTGQLRDHGSSRADVTSSPADVTTFPAST